MNGTAMRGTAPQPELKRGGRTGRPPSTFHHSPSVGLDLSLPRELSDVIRRPERQRLDRERRLASPARHERAAIHDEQVLHVV
ncbi:hypothetical protein D3C83_122240 [compost metagenome]